MNETGVYIVSGVPGAGKTTVSRLLAGSFRRGVHIEADRLQEWIVAGGLWPNETPAREATRQLRLRTRNVCLLADSYAEAGFTVVIDDVVIGSRLREFLTQLQARPLRFVLLTPRLETVQQRDAGRDKHVFDIWGHLDSHMRRRTPHIGLWLDTSELTEQETVAEIRRRADESVVETAAAGQPCLPPA